MLAVYLAGDCNHCTTGQIPTLEGEEGLCGAHYVRTRLQRRTPSLHKGMSFPCFLGSKEVPGRRSVSVLWVLPSILGLCLPDFKSLLCCTMALHCAFLAAPFLFSDVPLQTLGVCKCGSSRGLPLLSRVLQYMCVLGHNGGNKKKRFKNKTMMWVESSTLLWCPDTPAEKKLSWCHLAVVVVKPDPISIKLVV